MGDKPLIQDIVQKPLFNNRWVSHCERFDVVYEGKTNPLTFYHFKPDMGQKPVLPPYSGFFLSFFEMVSRFVRRGSIALDIGAYDGDTTLPIALAVGGGRVLAFDPGPTFSSHLTLNVKSNAFLNIEAFPYAVMAEDGLQEFSYCDCVKDFNGGYAPANKWVGTYTTPRLVWGVNLERFLAARGIDESNVSFIKIDTEGYDAILLLSLKGFLNRVRPVLHIEWFPKTENQIAEFVDYANYGVFCGFTLEKLNLDNCKWRQDLLLVPNDKTTDYDLTVMEGRQHRWHADAITHP